MQNESNIRGNKPTGISRFNQRVFFWQKRLAEHLNLKCRNISFKRLLVMLASFIFIIGAILLKLIICAIY